LKDSSNIFYRYFVIKYVYFSRTLEDRLGREFLAKGSKRWIDSLQDTNRQINNSVHSSIHMPPVNVTRRNARDLFDYLEQERSRQSRKTNTKLRLGDVVRIALAADEAIKFYKGFKEKWTRELFQIIQIHQGATVPTFSIVGSDDKPLHRRFYENELNLVIPLSDFN
jgi:hypothetical protein